MRILGWFLCVGLSAFFLYSPASAQDSPQFKVLFLGPDSGYYDPSFELDIVGEHDAFEMNTLLFLLYGEFSAPQKNQQSIPPDVKIIAEHIFHYLQRYDIFRAFAAEICASSGDNFHQRNISFDLLDTSCAGTKEQLRSLALASGSQYVVNIPLIRITPDASGVLVRAKLQIYDARRDTLPIYDITSNPFVEYENEKKNKCIQTMATVARTIKYSIKNYILGPDNVNTDTSYVAAQDSTATIDSSISPAPAPAPVTAPPPPPLSHLSQKRQPKKKMGALRLVVTGPSLLGNDAACEEQFRKAALATLSKKQKGSQLASGKSKGKTAVQAAPALNYQQWKADHARKVHYIHRLINEGLTARAYLSEVQYWNIRYLDTAVHNLQEYRSLAKSQHTPFILNISQVYIQSENEPYGDTIPTAQITVQLYDARRDSIIHEAHLLGQGRSWDLPADSQLISSAMITAIKSVPLEMLCRKIVGTYDTSVAQEGDPRSAIIREQFLHRPFDTETLREALSQNDAGFSHIQIIGSSFSPDHKKFVAFYHTLPEAPTNTHLQNPLEDSLRLLCEPARGYMVYGVQYKNKWYHESMPGAVEWPGGPVSDIDQETFLLHSLERTRYFLRDSALINPQFWSIDEFDTVADFFGTADWPIFKTEPFFRQKRLEYRQYAGMPRLAATEVRKEVGMKKETLDSAAIQTIFKPFYNRRHITLAAQSGDRFPVIASSMRSELLTAIPQKIDSTNVLRYYLYIPATASYYQWMLFPEQTITANDWWSDFSRQIAKISGWESQTITYDDPEFWNTYVLKKENGQYKYLKKIE